MKQQMQHKKPPPPPPSNMRCTRLRSGRRVEESLPKKVLDAKKAKALKILRSKSSNSSSNNTKVSKVMSSNPNRQLRPRFPYSPFDEWPTARASRMASLNAIAKVHVLYENEGHSIVKEGDDQPLESAPSRVQDAAGKNAKKEAGKPAGVKTESKVKVESRGPEKVSEKVAQAHPKAKHKVKKKKMRKRRSINTLDNVELIDTKSCKRLACLNAQAILAATGVLEKDKCKKLRRIPKSEDHHIESSLIKEVRISHRITSHVQKVVDGSRSCSPENNESKESAKVAEEEGGSEGAKEIVEATTVTETCRVVTSNNENNEHGNKMEIREVTQVHINTTQEMEIKEERKMKENVTRMYHYKTQGRSQSYYLQMHTTFKPKGASPPESPKIGEGKSYYTNTAGSTFSTQASPAVLMTPRYNTSAFSVPPHYAAIPGDYGYYQPAGPMIQPHHEACMIHKPVPYHPQQLYPPSTKPPDKGAEEAKPGSYQPAGHLASPPYYHHHLGPAPRAQPYAPEGPRHPCSLYHPYPYPPPAAAPSTNQPYCPPPPLYPQCPPGCYRCFPPPPETGRHFPKAAGPDANAAPKPYVEQPSPAPETESKEKEDCIIVIDDDDSVDKPEQPAQEEAAGGKQEEIVVVDDSPPPPPVVEDKKASPDPPFQPPLIPEHKRKFAHDWAWSGEPVEKQIVIRSDEPAVAKRCYPAICHSTEGDVIRVRDCVLLRSGQRKNDIPFVAKILELWEDNDGAMMMSLLWYYRPEHTDIGNKYPYEKDEIFASKHRDLNGVACIEDKCYVLTYGEFCRHRKNVRMAEMGILPPPKVVPDPEKYPRRHLLPPPRCSPENILFCRKVYDFRQKRILKNPT